MSEKITCQICDAQVHAIQLHLADHHEDISIQDYKEKYPYAPILSDIARQRIAEKNREKDASIAMSGVTAAEVTPIGLAATKKPLHELFKLGNVKAAKNAKGDPIPVTHLADSKEWADIVPDQDPNYIFSIELLKTALMGIELGRPTYLWGHAGTGKTTIWEQIAHYTNRPMIRVQHTANTEEAHIVGQTLANSEGTYFEPGALTLAMKHGWLYLADEYDFGHPSVLSVYQPVLEGKPLVIKEAPAEWRVIHPHENFRFVATGNTNGAGDDTGLYIGRNLGDAANYSRFAITEEVGYMPAKQEISVLVGQAKIVKEDAERLVDFANNIRKAFDGQHIGATIGPRELINAALIGLRRGNWKTGLKQAFINRLNRVDREAAEGVCQRIFE